MMTSPGYAILRLMCGFALIGVLLTGCGKPESQLKDADLVLSEVFPGAEPLAHRHRNHSLTESPDGQFRLYAAQKGDETDLVLLKRQKNGQWSAPQILDLPRLNTNTSPRFFPDGTLYYSSDGPHPDRQGRKDLNIWRVSLDADGVPGTPEVLPNIINTGSSEDGFTPLDQATAIFSSTTIGGEGGYDLYIGTLENGAWTVTPFAHNTIMADSHPVTTRDGKTLIWYAHLPSENVYGAVDLFVSHKSEAGWTLPQNMGPVINSKGIDYGAGVSADNKTLFFSRDGILLEVDLARAIEQVGYIHPDGIEAQ